jgi:elongation factor G
VPLLPRATSLPPPHSHTFAAQVVERTPLAEEKDAKLVALAKEKRAEMVERLAELDDELASVFLEGQEPSRELLKRVIRKATLDLSMVRCVARPSPPTRARRGEQVPVIMGASYKNKGVQTMLDCVVDYLPAPTEKTNVALDLEHDEKEITLTSDPSAPLVALAFKLEE